MRVLGHPQVGMINLTDGIVGSILDGWDVAGFESDGSKIGMIIFLNLVRRAPCFGTGVFDHAADGRLTVGPVTEVKEARLFDERGQSRNDLRVRAFLLERPWHKQSLKGNSLRTKTVRCLESEAFLRKQ